MSLASFFNPAEIIRHSLTAVSELFEWISYVLTMCVRSKAYDQQLYILLPRVSCPRQFAETSGKETFTARGPSKQNRNLGSSTSSIKN
jgi:hypothetical protein